MPRTLDPILQAGLENNTGSPIIRVHIVRNDAATFTSNEVLYYKLTNFEVKIKLAPFEFSISPGYAYVQIERGLLIDGVEYTVLSSWYIVRTIGITYHETIIKAHLFSINNISTPGDVAVNALLDTFIALTDVAHHTNTISWLANAEWWKVIQFLPTGKYLTLNNADQMINLMQQKYLVNLFDIGENKVMPIGASMNSEYPDTVFDHELTYTECADFEYNIPLQSTRYYFWIDEAGTIHYSGTSTRPRHNLGYIESTVNPVLGGFSNEPLYAVLSPPRLDICNGDYCKVTLPFDYTAVEMISRVFVDEIFDLHTKFTWRMELRAINWLENTEGGQIPGLLIGSGSYTPLITTGFDKNLKSTVNNLQALADAVDELTLRVRSVASSATPTPNADTTDMYILTALAVDTTFAAPTGSPAQGQKLIIRIKDNATARALAWNAIYRAMGVALPATTAISKTLYINFIYNSTDIKWDCVYKTQEA